MRQDPPQSDDTGVVRVDGHGCRSLMKRTLRRCNRQKPGRCALSPESAFTYSTRCYVGTFTLVSATGRPHSPRPRARGVQLPSRRRSGRGGPPGGPSNRRAREEGT